MHDNRNDGAEPAPRHANPSPPVGHVHGLGESHALRVELRAVQLPWLADEIDELRGPIEEELARERARHDQLTAGDNDRRSEEAREAEAEIDRRSYQLKLLAMIREQLPVDHAALAAVRSPWEVADDEPASEADPVDRPVAVVGPARGMLVLIRGAARNVAAALAEALGGPERGSDARAEHRHGLRWAELHRTTPAVAARLRAMAAAAEAFTTTYVDAVAQQAYSFDPGYYPTAADELW